MTLIKVKSRGTDNVAGRKNILYNGAMQINQRGNTTGNGVSGGSGVYSVDRWNLYHNGSEGVANLQQSTDVPSGEGFGNSYLIDVTTAESAMAAGEIAVLRQILEGYDLQRLKYGTSSAETLTLSFYVKSPKTGVHICELYHLASGGSKTQSQSYTVNSANTWEKKTITFSGDTATALDNDSNYTIAVQWGIFAGTTYTSGTLQTSWGSLDNAKRFVGQQNLFDNTSNNFYLTGTQLEVGDSASDFEHRSFGEELDLCERYFQTYSNRVFQGTNEHAANYSLYLDGAFRKRMRAAPTATFTGTVIIARPQVGISQRPNALGNLSDMGFMSCNWPSSGTYGGQLGSHGDAYYRMSVSGSGNSIDFNAEL